MRWGGGTVPIFCIFSCVPQLFSVAPAPPEWLDLLRVDTSALIFFTSPCGFFIVFQFHVVHLLGGEVVGIHILFLRKCTVCRHQVFDGGAILPVACARMAIYMEISMALFALPALLCPLGGRFACVRAGLPVTLSIYFPATNWPTTLVSILGTALFYQRGCLQFV